MGEMDLGVAFTTIPSGRAAPPARKTVTQQKQWAAMTAANVISSMKEARLKDEKALAMGTPPLHRVSIVDEVKRQCTKKMLLGHLVEGGILHELRDWLYDFKAHRPSPLELRSAALDILSLFPLESEMEAALAQEEKKNSRGLDLTQFMGITIEQLKGTDIGRAVNALRLDEGELKENRTKCIQLLHRFSKLFQGLPEEGKRSVVTWKCQGDPTVASPFESVETSSEAFAKKFMRPDPTDPTSYNNYLPWRPRAAVVTNLSGDLQDRLRGDTVDEEDV